MKLFNAKKQESIKTLISSEIFKKFELITEDLLIIRGGNGDPDGEGDTGTGNGEVE